MDSSNTIRTENLPDFPRPANKEKAVEYISRQQFIATWQRHFNEPVHPLAAHLLAPVQQVWMKLYDDEDTLWCVSDNSVSFVVGFILNLSDEGAGSWDVHLPSKVFARVQLPRTHFWLHQAPPLGSSRVSAYAKWSACLFCALEITFIQGGSQGQTGQVTAAAFFGSEKRER